MNLFVSFILRAVAVISKEIVLYVMYSNLPKDDPGWKSYSSSAVKKKTKTLLIIISRYLNQCFRKSRSITSNTAYEFQVV